MTGEKKVLQCYGVQVLRGLNYYLMYALSMIRG